MTMVMMFVSQENSDDGCYDNDDEDRRESWWR